MAAGPSRQVDPAAGSGRISHELWLWAKAQILALHPPPHRMGSSTYVAARSGIASRGAEAQPVTSLQVTNPGKGIWNQQQLHRELLFTHRKGLSLRSKPELLQVLEHRNRRKEGTEGTADQSPLEQELLRRQQRRGQNQQQEPSGDTVGNQPEFIRVRENLRRMHHSQEPPAPPPTPSPFLRSHLTKRQPLKPPGTRSPAAPQAEAPQLQGSPEVSPLSSAPSQCPLGNT